MTLKNFEGLDLGKIDRVNKLKISSQLPNDIVYFFTFLASLAAGVIVSNHGARQLDYVPATIMSLEEVSLLTFTLQ